MLSNQIKHINQSMMDKPSSMTTLNGSLTEQDKAAVIMDSSSFSQHNVFLLPKTASVLSTGSKHDVSEFGRSSSLKENNGSIVSVFSKPPALRVDCSLLPTLRENEMQQQMLSPLRLNPVTPSPDSSVFTVHCGEWSSVYPSVKGSETKAATATIAQKGGCNFGSFVSAPCQG